MKILENNKKIVGVMGRPTPDDINLSCIAIYQNVRQAIIKNNCIPLMIIPPNSIDYVNTKTVDIKDLTESEKKEIESFIDICDGIIFPGGNRWYNFDLYACEYAIKKDIPVLGICLGMQTLACYDNGEYPLKKNETLINHKQRELDYVHKINIVHNTKLSNIFNNKVINVNSSHNYHVTKVNNFIVSAYSEDGLIEGIELPNKRFVVGVQWHPEKMIDYDDNQKEFLNKFFDLL